jgi:cell division septation protein DedD
VAPTVIETPVAKPVSVAKAAPVTAKAAPEEKKPEPEETEKPKLIQFEDSQDDDTDALIIKLSWIRNAVAVAAAVIMFILITTPISNSDPNLEYSQLGTPAIFDTTKKNVDPVMKDTKALEHEIAQDSIMRAIAKADSIASAKADSIVFAKADSIATAKAVEEKKDSVVKDVTGYCLVLASYVSMKNANAYVERLHKAGFTEAEVYVRNKVTRVVYGNFQSMNDAYNRLNQIRRGNKDFEEAWVLKTTDRG